MPKRILTPQAVDELLRDCLFSEDEAMTDAIIVDGIVNKYGLHPDRVAANTREITALLAELPESFRENKGGGWSFLCACENRHGEQWTGLHVTIERLVVLGIAAGKARWLLPRKMWSALPGGMPYFSVTIEPTESADEPA